VLWFVVVISGLWTYYAWYVAPFLVSQALMPFPATLAGAVVSGMVTAPALFSDLTSSYRDSKRIYEFDALLDAK